MIANTGHTPSVVRDEWDLPLLRSMAEHWRVHPPVHVLKAAEMGYEPPAVEQDASAQSDLGGFFQAVDAMNGGM